MLELSLLCCYKNVDDLCVPKRKCVCKRSLTSLSDKERERVCVLHHMTVLYQRIFPSHLIFDMEIGTIVQQLLDHRYVTLEHCDMQWI